MNIDSIATATARNNTIANAATIWADGEAAFLASLPVAPAPVAAPVRKGFFARLFG